MKRLYSFFVFIFLFPFIHSQVIDKELLNDLKARNIGPGGMSGRVTAIAVDPMETSVFYVGTASGGIWKTTNGGINFSPIFDDQAVAGIGAITIDPNNPDVVWVGTGEGNPRNSITGGYGLYRSLDAGKSWELIGLEETRHIHRIIVEPGNSEVVYVGAIGSPWGPHKERGVYKTSDGGNSWEQVLFVNEQTGVADMVIDPRNPKKLFVAMWEHIRHPWHFKSGGEGSGLYITLNGGKDWKQVTSKEGLPKGELGRIGLAVSKSNPAYVYAIVEAKENAIYRSVDGGFNWQRRGTENIGGRPFYYAEIYVDPENENRLYSLFTNVNVSEDGGMSFSNLVGRNIHSDHHAWWIYPDNPDFMIDGNDGGMAITYDRGKSWQHVTNLPVSQFYHIRVDDDLPYNVYGGMQDNGSWKGPAYVWSSNGIINEYWEFLIGGDGFDVLPIPGDSKYCYAMSQQGNIQRINTETGQGTNIQPAETDVKLRWHWNSALAQDPFNKNTIYFGSQFVHKSIDRGDSWETISGDLTTNDTSRQTYNKSGGLTYDVTGAETYTCILAIAPSPVEEGVIWAGTDDGNIQLTRDGGKTWTNTIAKIKNYPDRPWVPQIVTSNYNGGEAFVVANNYRQNDYAPYLYHTTDYGKSWVQIVDDSDVSGYVLSFIQDPEEENLMFLGTEFGLYVSINKGKDWVKYTNGYPTVSTMDLAIQEREVDLVIGTFGRSAYVIDDIRPLRQWAEQGDAFKEEVIQVFEPPTSFMASTKNAPGYYFRGDGLFEGENRRRGAPISFYVKDGVNPEEVGGRSPKDTVLIKILDEKGEVVRLMQDVPVKGINKTYWFYDKNGISLDFGGMGRRGRGGGRPGASSKYRGGGGTIIPGTYTVRMLYKGDSTETTLTVKPDPRMEFDLQADIKRLEVLEEIKEELKTFNEKVKKINNCNTTLSTVKTLAQNAKSDTVLNAVKAIQKTISSLNKELNGEQNVKGIYEDESLFIYNVSPLIYLFYYSTPLTPNLMVTINEARKLLDEMDAKLETFLKEDWAAFEAFVKMQDLPLF
ncbi:hypothetical protein ACFLT1_07370 [Bacteroidota bacterium]